MVYSHIGTAIRSFYILILFGMAGPNKLLNELPGILRRNDADVTSL